MSKSFLDAVRQGKNQWWRYLCSLLLILFSWQIIGGFVFGIAISFAGIVRGISSEKILESLSANSLLDLSSLFPPILSYLIFHVPFVFLAVGLFIAIKFIHQRPILSLIRGDATIRWRRVFQGLKLWIVLSTGIEFLKYFLNPSSYQINFHPVQWILLVLLASIITTIQTSLEELLFRGYLLQGLSLITKNKLVLIVVTGIIFAVFHFANPSMAINPVVMGLLYFAFGVFLALITLKDNGLELALGQHAANNFLVVILFGTKTSVLPPTGVFISESILPTIELISFLFMAAVFYYFLLVRHPLNQ